MDFQDLNKITKEGCYPLPHISNLLDALSYMKVYSKIDLQYAYHLVYISNGNEWKMFFQTCYGSYKWLVMPFDLTNACTVFQWFINTIFANLLDIAS